MLTWTMSDSSTSKRMTNKQRQFHTSLYAAADFAMAMLAWALFFLYRKHVEGVHLDLRTFADPNFIKGVLLIPVGWTLLYGIFGHHADIYRQSRLQTLSRTIFISFFGVLFLFFTLMLDDVVPEGHGYLRSFLVLLSLHLTLTALSRMILLTAANRRIKAGKIQFNTLLIGGNQSAVDLYREISSAPKQLGYHFIGFIDTNGNPGQPLQQYLPRLGGLSDLPEVVQQHHVEEAIIAVETSEHGQVQHILGTLFDFGDKLLVKIIPDMYDILLGTVKMTHVFGAVLIDIRQELMPHWQKVLKRMMDVGASAGALLVLSPVLGFIAFRVRRSSPGPILYHQERIGQYGKPFFIHKFRSMYVDAESRGPQLSTENDPRCTPWGATMRKYRLDELPNFWNVLVGEMSLVGPRPERQHFIDQIVQENPHYKQLLKVRPGITSWGQVKYGYASDLKEMVQRLKFDLLYIENMSLALDLKIMFYTLLVLLQGRGR